MAVFSTGVGIVGTLISILCNGSFAAVTKMKVVQDAKVEPIIMMLFMSVGVFVSSWLVIPFYGVGKNSTTSVHFSGMGMLSGSLLIFSVTCAFFAVSYVGLSIGQGTWGGSALFVAYMWGVLAFGHKPKTVWFGVLALVLLLAGTVGIAFCQQIAARFCSSATGAKHHRLMSSEESEDPRTSLTAAPADRVNSLDIENKARAASAADVDKDTEPMQLPSRSIMVLGLSCAVGVGLFGGSILVPNHYAPKDAAQLGLLPSFGIGSMLAGPLVAVGYYCIQRRIPKFASKSDFWVAAAAGTFSGVVWNIGNVAAIFGIGGLGYSVAYSLVQTALFVSGLWGVFVFHEIRGASVVVFFASSAVLLSGAAVLATVG